MKLHFVSYTHFVVLSGRMIAYDELENLWEELAGGWTRAHNDELHNVALHQMLLRRSSQRG